MYITWRPIYFLIISPSGLLRIRNVSDKRCTEKKNVNFIHKTLFLENRVLNGILWKRVTEPDRPQMTKWRKVIAFWISRTTDKYSEYFIDFPFPQQQWLNENASILCYTYIFVLCMLTSFWVLYCVYLNRVDSLFSPSDFTLSIIRSWVITLYYLYCSSIGYNIMKCDCKVQRALRHYLP
jgi:hypothetical protein